MEVIKVFDIDAELARLHNSILKHGFDNHVFEIIAECDIIDRNKIENYYGNIYEVLGSNGLNCRLPLYEKYACMSDDTKMKISIANKGKNGLLMNLNINELKSNDS